MADFRRKKVIVFDELRGNVETEQQTRPISRIPFFFFFAPPPRVARLQTEWRWSAGGRGGELDRAKCMSRSTAMYLCLPNEWLQHWTHTAVITWLLKGDDSSVFLYLRLRFCVSAPSQVVRSRLLTELLKWNRATAYTIQNDYDISYKR